MGAVTDDFAVLLNPNARRVSRNVFDRISDIVDPGDVYVSKDEASAPALVEQIVEKGYGTVFTGGGDGTVTRFINMLPEERSPRVGILKLGTGNAMAEIVSSGDPLVDLSTFASNPTNDDFQLSLCEAEGTRFAFAGLGIDGWVLNDYRAMKERFGDGPLRPLLQNVGGYLAAAFAVTVPRMVKRWMKRHKTEVRVRNVGGPAYSIVQDDLGGHVGRTFAPGDVIYEGPVNNVMFGTCPFYGYGMKALPYAGLDPRRFHLRLSNLPVGKIVTSLPSLWRGALRHPGLMDFHVDRVHVEFSEPMPYQLAGEAMGYREELTIGMSQKALELVRFI
ncbi:MAG: diacylglycerol/lipid kinase family protein [Myxococcota bacterium]